MKHDSLHSRSMLIGCAAGFSGDRTDAAAPVVETLIERGTKAGLPSFLIFETLAERTLALAQLRRREDPGAGYEPLLDAMLGPVLARCLAHDVRIVSNFGAANPRGAADRIRALAVAQGLKIPRIAVIEGDDVSGPASHDVLRAGLGAEFEAERVVSANAYLGAEPIADALRAGAQIVVAGRVADPSLVVGPARAHFGWGADDWTRIARATMAGHLLECGAQVCGGYFADPGYKEVPDLHAVGFPIAQIDADGTCEIFKAERTGGRIDRHTVTEQLLYEVHDPSAYVTPDVTADIAAAHVHETGRDRVRLDGVRGHARTDSLKVNVCFEGGWLAEGEISYAGPGAEDRARLAADVLRRRLPRLHLRFDLIGAISLFADDGGRLLGATPAQDARDVRLRVAAADTDRTVAESVLHEVTALYTCGPAGGGGVRTSVRRRLNTRSCLVPRDAVRARFDFVS